MQMSMRLRNELSVIPRLMEALDPFAKAQGFSDEELFNLNLCLDELLTNTINYGYDDQENHEINVTLDISGELMTLALEDDAAPFNPLEKSTVPDLEVNLEERVIGGLGIYLVRTFMDDIRYSRIDGHNRIELEKRLHSKGL